MPHPVADRRDRPRAGQAGFSLTELLVTIAVAGIFAAGLYAAYSSGIASTTRRGNESSAQADARLAADLFARDVRQAVSPDGIGGESATSPLASVGCTAVVLYVDQNRGSILNAQGVPTVTPKRVEWSLSGTNLIRRQAPGVSDAFGPAEVVVESVGNDTSRSIFRARKVGVSGRSAGTCSPTPDPAVACVEALTLDLVIQDRSGASPRSTELTTDAVLRNPTTADRGACA